MSFEVRKLAVLAYAQGFTLWYYPSPVDTLDAIAAPGYFDHAADMFAPRDQIHLTSKDGGGLAHVDTVGTDTVQVRLMARTAP